MQELVRGRGKEAWSGSPLEDDTTKPASYFFFARSHVPTPQNKQLCKIMIEMTLYTMKSSWNCLISFSPHLPCIPSTSVFLFSIDPKNSPKPSLNTSIFKSLCNPFSNLQNVLHFPILSNLQQFIRPILPSFQINFLS